MTSKFPARRPLLYLITEGKLTDDNFDELKRGTMEKVRTAVELGVDLVQIREKSLSAGNVFALCRDLRGVCRSRSLLLVNDRFDIALAAEMDGVHLTETSLPVSAVRGVVGRRLLIGCSRHTLEGVKESQASGADFAVLGPIFRTPGKGDPIGIQRFREVCVAVKDFPVFGLGGINSDNAATVTEAGAAGIAAIRFLSDTEALANFKWQ